MQAASIKAARIALLIRLSHAGTACVWPFWLLLWNMERDLSARAVPSEIVDAY
jgi:hypothetical protein